MMKEPKAVKPVGEQLLRFAKGWSGVENPLIKALGEIGDKKAAKYLEKYCLDERASQAAIAERVLKKLDPKAAARVEKAKESS